MNSPVSNPRAPPPRSWAELIGQDGNIAKRTILEEFPTYNVHLCPLGTAYTLDLRMDRVRIDVDENNIVVYAPKVG